jgi:hypothetical protein
MSGCGTTRNKPTDERTNLFNQSGIARVLFYLDDDAAADYRRVGVLPDFGDLLGSRDSKPNGNRQIGESLDPLNQIRGGFRQALPHACHTGSRDCIYEPGACFAHKFDSFVGTGRRDQKYKVDVGRLHCRSKFIGLFRHQVSAQHGVDTGAPKLISYTLGSKRQERIQITEEHDRDFAALPDAPYNFETITDACLIGKRSFGRSLNYRSVGHRIGERHPELDDVGTTALQFEYELLCDFERGISTGDVRDETFTPSALQVIEL